MNRFRSLSPTPSEIASAKLQQEVSQLISAHSSTSVQRSLAQYVNLFKPARAIGFTSERTTENILKHARVPYFPPYEQAQRFTVLKQAAIEHSESKQIINVACRQAQREVSIALKRVKNKQLKETMHIAHQRALQSQIQKLDDNVGYLVDHYANINDAKYQEEDDRLRLRYRVQKSRIQNKELMRKVREIAAQERIEEGRKAKQASLSNLIRIREQQEEIIAEKVNKYRIAQAEKNSTNSRQASPTGKSDLNLPILLAEPRTHKSPESETKQRNTAPRHNIEISTVISSSGGGGINPINIKKDRSTSSYNSNRPISTKATATPGGTNSSNRFLKTMKSTMDATPPTITAANTAPPTTKNDQQHSPKPTLQDQLFFVSKVINKLKEEEAKIEVNLRNSLTEKIRLKTELGLIRAPPSRNSRGANTQSNTNILRPNSEPSRSNNLTSSNPNH